MGLTYTFICGAHNTSGRNRNISEWLLLHQYKNTAVLNLLSVFLIEESWFDLKLQPLNKYLSPRRVSGWLTMLFVLWITQIPTFSFPHVQTLLHYTGGRGRLWAIEH